MGSPVYPDGRELELLSQASVTVPETLPFRQDRSDSVTEFTLAQDAVILLNIISDAPATKMVTGA